jgi:hypothetical protein
MSTTRQSVFAILALAAVVSVSGPTSAEAQTRRRNTAGSPSAGILAGLTWSGMSTKDDVTLKNIWGAQAGVFVDQPLTPEIGARIEVLVSQRGAKNEITGNTMRLAYLDIPLLVKIGNTATNDVHVHAFTGLTPGFLLKTDTTNGAGLASDFGADAKKFDLGWVIGAGVEQHAWSFDARYTFGLVTINSVPNGSDYKNRSLSMNVGYRFR